MGHKPLRIFVTARPLAIGFVAFLVASLRRTPKKYASPVTLLVGTLLAPPCLSSKGLAVTYNISEKDFGVG